MEETQATPTVETSPAPQPSRRSNDYELPRGKFASQYGVLFGTGGVMFALLEIFRDDPKGSVSLFAQFGPKYILWGFIAYIIWDLSKKAIKVANKGADNVGALAQNMGKMATSVDAIANKSDRQAEEMRRLCSYSASQSERAVELAKETNELLVDLHGKLSKETQPEVSS